MLLLLPYNPNPTLTQTQTLSLSLSLTTCIMSPTLMTMEPSTSGTSYHSPDWRDLSCSPRAEPAGSTVIRLISSCAAARTAPAACSASA